MNKENWEVSCPVTVISMTNSFKIALLKIVLVRTIT